MFTNLLVPLTGRNMPNGPSDSKKACVMMPCTVKLLHVIEKTAAELQSWRYHLQDVAGAERYLAAISEKVGGWGCGCRATCYGPQGDIRNASPNTPRKLEQDLIVLCTHGSGGVRRLCSEATRNRC